MTRRTMPMMTRRKDGEYYYAPKRRRWGVWQNHVASDGFEYGEFITDFATRDEAVLEVYKRNGWKIKQ